MSFFGTDPDFGDHFTFENFGLSMVTLFRCATADSWETRLYASRSTHPWAPVYYVLFMVFCSMVMTNLFIAVILVRVPDVFVLRSTHCDCRAYLPSG